LIWHPEFELGGNVVGGLDFKTSTSVGKIANDARHMVSPEKDLPGFERSETERAPAVFHIAYLENVNARFLRRSCACWHS